MTHLTDSQLNEYLDHALTASVRDEAGAHLRSCAECRARLDEIQFVFTSLAELPEARIAYDLSAAVLSRLPQKQSRVWDPFFPAQLGAALGALLWLSTQITKFIPTDFSALHFPQFTIPTLQFPALYSLFSNLYSLLYSPLPALNLPTFQLSTFQLAITSISVFALWVIGNATLLRNRPEVQK